MTTTIKAPRRHPARYNYRKLTGKITMGVITTTSTQYGDFRGTISVKGGDRGFVQALAHRSEMPGSYFPIGMEVDSDAGAYVVYVLAVDQYAVESHGKSVASYAAQVSPVPVFRYKVNATVEDVLRLVHRLHVVAFDKVLDGKELKIFDNR
jgi:hypothetical protein